MSNREIRAGTRGSALALWQTEFVLGQLRAIRPDLNLSVLPIRSRGDRDQQTPLPSLGGKGLFTAELEAGLLDGSMDIAVHSLKDLPIADPPGLRTAAILAREEARDALICPAGYDLDTLPANSIVGTSSTRRCGQILARRPDLQVRSIRGNVDTRLRKVEQGEYDAIVLAGAGLLRMGLGHHVREWLAVDWFTPAPGQGALAVQCRAEDVEVLELLQHIHEPELAQLVLAERTFLAELGGGCSEPVGAWASFFDAPADDSDTPERQICLQGWYSTPDGQRYWQGNVFGPNLNKVSERAARAARSEVDYLSHRQKSASPLHQTRPKVAITRSVQESLQACRTALSAGLQPIVAPVLDLKPLLAPAELAEAVGDVDRFDWLVLTSANAAQIFFDHWAQNGGNIRDFARLKIAAVGPHTAERIRAAGLDVQAVPQTYSALGLLSDGVEFAGCRILIPHSALSSPELQDGLQQRGADVTVLPLYQPQALALDAMAVRTLSQGVEMISFASGSAVDAFCEEIARHGDLCGLLDSTPVACIGPQTARHALAHGLHVKVVSEIHTMEGLMGAIAQYFALAESDLEGQDRIL